MKWWKRLDVRMPLFLGLLALGPLLVFGLTMLEGTDRRLKQHLHDSTQEILGYAADTAERSIQNSIHKIQIGLNVSEINLRDKWNQEWILQLLQKEIPEIHSVSILNLKGMETAKISTEKVFSQEALTDRSQTPAFSSALDKTVYVGKVKTSSLGTQRLTIALPLVDPRKQNVIGVLAAELSVRKLLRRIMDMRVDQSGIIFVLDQTGRVIAHPDLSRVLAGNHLTERSFYRHRVEQDDTALNALQTRIDADGVKRLTTGRQSRELGWVFMFEQPESEALALVKNMNRHLRALLAIIALLAAGITVYFIIRYVRPLKRLESAADRLGKGSLEHRVAVATRDELGAVAAAFNAMAARLQEASIRQKQQDWVKTGKSELDDVMRGELDLDTLCEKVATFLSRYLNAPVGTFYLRGADGAFRLTASYAFKKPETRPDRFMAGEGLIGQAVLERQPVEVSRVPEDYVTVTSGLGDQMPQSLFITPFVFNDTALGVLELGTIEAFTEDQKNFLNDVSERVAVALHSAMARWQLNDALQKTQQQAETLEAQEEALRAANEELEEKTQGLQASEAALRAQEEELRAANEALQEKAKDFKWRQRRPRQ